MDVRAAAGPGARGVRALRGEGAAGAGRGVRPALSPQAPPERAPEAGQGCRVFPLPSRASPAPSPAVWGSARLFVAVGKAGRGAVARLGGCRGCVGAVPAPLSGSIVSSRCCRGVLLAAGSAPAARDGPCSALLLPPAPATLRSSPAPAPAPNLTEMFPNPPALIFERANL